MFGSSSTFIRLVEKATSQLLLEPDWDSTLQICDSIRQGDVQTKYALQIIKKKVSQDNPHVSMFALHVLESCVKNCGGVVHEEIATKEFMEFLKDLVKKRPDPVKAKILELIQVWSHAFRNEPSYKVVQDTFHLMKMEGHTFPQLKEADIMFAAEKAPEWKDGECCHRCRVGFSTFQRKHHCRHCGNVFCNKCSAKNSIIPKFGLEREVRVCDSCYDDINGPADGKKDDESLPQVYLESPLSKQSQQPPSKSEQELQEEEELQLALALSMSEQNNKDKNRSRAGNNPATTTPGSNPVYAQPTKVTGLIDTSDMDPELARYLNRTYWDKKHEGIKPSTTQPSAPVIAAETKTSTGGSTVVEKVEEKMQNGESSEDEEQFLRALNSSIEIFVNRMRSNSARGRSIATDSSVQTLFMTINAMHPQLMNNLSQLEDARSYYETLQDKLAQLKDAREALDALRDEQREKRRREQEELERQRQIQMSQKLDVLRQKKQEYLDYQRQMALQRMREQEMEMQMRLEQQKHLQHVRALQYSYPQMYNQQTYSPGGSAEGSPLHQAHPGAVPMGSQAPYQQLPPGQMPPGAPGGQMPPGQMPPGQMLPQGQIPPPGHMPPGQQMGQLPPGSMPQTSMPPGGVPHGAVAPGGMPLGGAAPGGMVAGQPIYNQPGYQPSLSQPPGGYQQGPPGSYPATTYNNMPGQYPAPVTQPPPAGQQPTTAPPGQDYQNYNMQSLAGALPQGAPGPPLPASGQQIPGQPYMPPAQVHYVPPGAQPIAQGQPPAQGHAGQPPAQGQQIQPNQQQQMDQLISFD